MKKPVISVIGSGYVGLCTAVGFASKKFEVILTDKDTKKIDKNKIKYATSTNDCLKNAECCIIITEWEEFKKLTPKDFIENMKQPNLIDSRRIYNPNQFKNKLKFKAIGLGK